MEKVLFIHTMAKQGDSKASSVQLLACQRPLGLLHLRRMYAPVDFECHQYVVIHVHVSQVKIGESIHSSEATRAYIPNVNGVKWPEIKVDDDHLVLLDCNPGKARGKLF